MRPLAVLFLLVVVACSSGAPAASQAATTTPTVTGRDLAFSPTSIVVPAGQLVTLTYDNPESINHNLRINGVSEQPNLATPLARGPRQDVLTFTIAAAGSYQFTCDVHATMVGTLTVR